MIFITFFLPLIKQLTLTEKIGSANISTSRYICRSPDRNLGRSGICQTRLEFYSGQGRSDSRSALSYFRPDKNSHLATQIPDLPRPDGNL